MLPGAQECSLGTKGQLPAAARPRAPRCEHSNHRTPWPTLLSLDAVWRGPHPPQVAARSLTSDIGSGKQNGVSQPLQTCPSLNMDIRQATAYVAYSVRMAAKSCSSSLLAIPCDVIHKRRSQARNAQHAEALLREASPLRGCALSAEKQLAPLGLEDLVQQSRWRPWFALGA